MAHHGRDCLTVVICAECFSARRNRDSQRGNPVHYRHVRADKAPGVQLCDVTFCGYRKKRRMNMILCSKERSNWSACRCCVFEVILTPYRDSGLYGEHVRTYGCSRAGLHTTDHNITMRTGNISTVLSYMHMLFQVREDK